MHIYSFVGIDAFSGSAYLAGQELTDMARKRGKTVAVTGDAQLRSGQQGVQGLGRIGRMGGVASPADDEGGNGREGAEGGGRWQVRLGCALEQLGDRPGR